MRGSWERRRPWQEYWVTRPGPLLRVKKAARLEVERPFVGVVIIVEAHPRWDSQAKAPLCDGLKRKTELASLCNIPALKCKNSRQASRRDIKTHFVLALSVVSCVFRFLVRRTPVIFQSTCGEQRSDLFLLFCSETLWTRQIFCLSERCQRPERPPGFGHPPPPDLMQKDGGQSLRSERPPWQICWIFNEIFSNMGRGPSRPKAQAPHPESNMVGGCSGLRPCWHPSRYIGFFMRSSQFFLVKFFVLHQKYGLCEHLFSEECMKNAMLLYYKYIRK